MENKQLLQCLERGKEMKMNNQDTKGMMKTAENRDKEPGRGEDRCLRLVFGMTPICQIMQKNHVLHKDSY